MPNMLDISLNEAVKDGTNLERIMHKKFLPVDATAPVSTTDEKSPNKGSVVDTIANCTEVAGNIRKTYIEDGHVLEYEGSNSYYGSEDEIDYVEVPPIDDDEHSDECLRLIPEHEYTEEGKVVSTDGIRYSELAPKEDVYPETRKPVEKHVRVQSTEHDHEDAPSVNSDSETAKCEYTDIVYEPICKLSSNPANSILSGVDPEHTEWDTQTAQAQNTSAGHTISSTNDQLDNTNHLREKITQETLNNKTDFSQPHCTSDAKVLPREPAPSADAQPEFVDDSVKNTPNAASSARTYKNKKYNTGMGNNGRKAKVPTVAECETGSGNLPSEYADQLSALKFIKDTFEGAVKGIQEAANKYVELEHKRNLDIAAILETIKHADTTKRESNRAPSVVYNTYHYHK